MRYTTIVCCLVCAFAGCQASTPRAGMSRLNPEAMTRQESELIAYGLNQVEAEAEHLAKSTAYAQKYLPAVTLDKDVVDDLGEFSKDERKRAVERIVREMTQQADVLRERARTIEHQRGF